MKNGKEENYIELKLDRLYEDILQIESNETIPLMRLFPFRKFKKVILLILITLVLLSIAWLL